MMDDRLKFTGSIRYDKAQNFDGNYSPRLSVVYSGGQNKTIILRFVSKPVLETHLHKINILDLM
jgi:outer membrane receptor protein involved in Fe transport